MDQDVITIAEPEHVSICDESITPSPPHRSQPKPKSKTRYCIQQGCAKQACYNLLDQKQPIFCLSHKSLEMVDVIHKPCVFPGCKVRPSYNYENLPAQYCVSHKDSSMVAVGRHHRCAHESCNKQPTFNHFGEKSAKYCKAHMLPNMVDVISKKCEAPGCSLIPHFNYPGHIKRFCSTHRSDGMLYIGGVRECLETGCHVQPSCNFPGQTVPIYCKSHAFPDMIDVVTPRCIYPGCSAFSYYNDIGKREKLYCSRHKTESMIAVRSWSKFTRKLSSRRK